MALIRRNMAYAIAGSGFVLGLILGFLVAKRRKHIKFGLYYETHENKEDEEHT